MLSDSELLTRYCADRDEQAFQEIVLRHEPWVRYQCQARMVHQHEADEATQAVFVLLARKADALHNRQALAAWLQRVIHGITANMLTASRARRYHESAAGQLALDQARVARVEEEAATGDAAPDDEFKQAVTILPDCLNDLPPLDREVLIRHHLRQQKLKDIALELNSTPTAIQKRASRARDRLEVLMRRRGVVATAALLLAIGQQVAAAHSTQRVDAIMSAIRDGSADDMVASFSQLAYQPGSNASFITVFNNVSSLWSMKYVGVSALLIAGIIYGLFHLTSQSSQELVVKQLVGEVSWQDQPVANASVVLPLPGALGTAGDGQAVVSWGTETTITQRSSSMMKIVDNQIILTQGALVVFTEQEQRVSLPRFDCLIKGEVRLLSVDLFDRIDVVSGTARVVETEPKEEINEDYDSGIQLSAGQALSRGHNCPLQPFATSPYELSPAYGGLFYRHIAELYSRSELAVDQDVHYQPVYQPSLDNIKQRASYDKLTLSVADDGSRMTIENPIENRLPRVFSLPIPQWPKLVASKITLTNYQMQGEVRDLSWRNAAVQNADELAWLVDNPLQRKESLRFPGISSELFYEFSQLSVPVGQTPDGRNLWEKGARLNEVGSNIVYFTGAAFFHTGGDPHAVIGTLPATARIGFSSIRVYEEF